MRPPKGGRFALVIWWNHPLRSAGGRPGFARDPRWLRPGGRPSVPTEPPRAYGRAPRGLRPGLRPARLRRAGLRPWAPQGCAWVPRLRSACRGTPPTQPIRPKSWARSEHLGSSRHSPRSVPRGVARRPAPGMGPASAMRWPMPAAPVARAPRRTGRSCPLQGQSRPVMAEPGYRPGTGHPPASPPAPGGLPGALSGGTLAATGPPVGAAGVPARGGGRVIVTAGAARGPGTPARLPLASGLQASKVAGPAGPLPGPSHPVLPLWQPFRPPSWINITASYATHGHG